MPSPLFRNRKALVALVGILAAALNLRIAIIAVGPVIEDIRADTGMSSTVAGLLGAVPFVCMGVFAFVGVPLVRAIGANRVITYALWLLIVGTLARAVMPSPALIVASTIPIGIGIALAGMSVPVFVKEHFGGRPGAVTGAYVASLSVAGGVAAIAIVPLADALGGWRWAFAATTVPAVLALPLWQRAARLGQSAAPKAAALRTELRRLRHTRPRAPSGLALRVAVIFGVQSACFAAGVNWVAALYRDEGWSPDEAAVLTALIPLVTVPAALFAPVLSDGRDRRPWLVGMTALMVTGMAGVAFAPTAAPYVWVTLWAFGAGSIFPLTLVLPIDLNDTPAKIAEMTGWTLGIGYLISAMAPALVGALRDLTGGFTVPMAVVAAAGSLSGILALTKDLRPRHTRLRGGRVVTAAGAAAAPGPEALGLAAEPEPRPDQTAP